MQKIGQYIRNFRQGKGWSQVAISVKLEVDRTYISKLERGRLKYQPSTRLLDRLARLTGDRPEYVYGLANRIPQEMEERLAQEAVKGERISID